MTFPIGDRPVTIPDLVAVARDNAPVALTKRPAVRRRIQASREHLLAAIRRGDVIYGVNTGVGTNAVFVLPPDQAERFQEHNLRQLICGTGAPLPSDIVRGAMLLRAVTLALGCSAVRVEVIEQLVRLLNAGITPIVPRYGSVGASGDLIPSGYIARALLGQGGVLHRGRSLSASAALRRAGIAPLRLSYKEGLSLINGTTVMTAAAALVLDDARALLRAFLCACALSIEALGASPEPFEDWVQRAKGHRGQRAVALFVRRLLRGSRAVASGKVRMQSGYSVRCLPQGIGPMYDTLAAARPVIETEANSANDNPLIDPATGRIYTTGNFYGGHVARAADAVKLDLANLANWCHALMAVLVDDRMSGGLPPALAPRPGRDTGFKGMQLSLASLACAVRQMASPSTVHPVSTEQHNQDMVSLGVHAALTACDSLDCTRDAVAILLLAACHAVDLRGCVSRLGAGSARVHRAIRALSPPVRADRPLDADIAAVAQSIPKEDLWPSF